MSKFHGISRDGKLITVRTETGAEAFELAKSRMGSQNLSISAIYFVRGNHLVRDFVYRRGM